MYCSFITAEALLRNPVVIVFVELMLKSLESILVKIRTGYD